ncbi:MAG TPA: hypothetical protein VKT75_08550 [Acidobacteriaceae bacterium]|nr:hypothetical protein [Acidobacteriaceae bacterium]
MERVRCPNCKDGDEVYRSHRRKWDWPFLWMGMRPYRCLLCNKRFYARRHRPDPAGHKVP